MGINTKFTNGHQHVENTSHGWLIALAAFVNFFIIGGHFMGFSLLYPAIREYFGVDYAVSGWVGSVSQAMTHLPGIVYSGMVTKYGCRFSNILGACLAASGYILSYYSPNVYLLYFTYGVLTGSGIGLMNLSSIVILQQYFTKRRALVFALSNTGISLGITGLSILIKYLLSEYGWKGTVLIFGSVCFHGTAAGLLFKEHKNLENKNNTSESMDQKSTANPDTFTDNNVILTGEEVLPDTNTTESMDPEIAGKTDALFDYKVPLSDKKKKSFFRIMLNFSVCKQPAFMLYCTATFCMNIGMLTFYMHTPSRALKYNIPRDLVGWLPSAIALSTLASRIGTTFVLGIGCSNRIFIYGSGMLVGGVIDLVYIYCTDAVSIFVCCIITGFSIGMQMSVQSTVLVDLLGKQMIAQAQALLGIFIGTAALLATPFAGVLFDISQGYTVPFLVCGTIQVLGATIILAMYLRQRLK